MKILIRSLKSFPPTENNIKTRYNLEKLPQSAQKAT
jgi:hypothetical protein